MAVEPTPDPKPIPKTRKARVKPDGLEIKFLITDTNEIKQLNDLAAADRRTPENFVSLLVYKHLKDSATKPGSGAAH